jgi:chromosome segregation and condensation protein ScpB
VHVHSRVTSEQRSAALSTEAVAILGYVGWHGEATRRQVEEFRGEDSETLLGRLLEAGFLAAVRDSRGRRPNRYRLSTLALEAFGVASLEELHAKLEPFLAGLPEGEPFGAIDANDEMVTG